MPLLRAGPAGARGDDVVNDLKGKQIQMEQTQNAQLDPRVAPTEVKIALGGDLFALVDAEDLEKVLPYAWRAAGKMRQKYAKAEIRIGDRRCRVSMHRIILPVDDPNFVIDHINGNGLDNRRSNLRIATKSQNAMNSVGRSDRRADYKGMTMIRKSLWQAQITVGKNVTHLGNWHTQECAALSYNRSIEKYHGEFGKPNVIPMTRQEVINAEILAAYNSEHHLSLRRAIKKLKTHLDVKAHEIVQAIADTGIDTSAKKL